MPEITTISEEKSNALFAFWFYLVFGALIVGLFVFVIVFRKPLKDVISNYNNNLSLRIILWKSRRKIEKIDNQIRNLNSKVATGFSSQQYNQLDLVYTTNELVQKVIDQDVEKEPIGYDKDFYPKMYDYSSGDKFEKMLQYSLGAGPSTKKFKVVDGGFDINEIVDRVLTIKEEETSFEAIKEIQRHVEDIMSFRGKRQGLGF